MSELTSNSEQLEYIPSTEEVRDFISKTVWSAEQFDRWLEQIQNEWYTKGFNAAHATFRR